MQNFNRDLREGSRVSKGKTIIGYVGSTGPHVHLTIYEYSKSENSWLKVNPLKYTQGCALPDNFNANRYQFENCSQISRAT
jgi:murein DD-endopeptidase MepM/ murein hydrolase activator NlpD